MYQLQQGSARTMRSVWQSVKVRLVDIDVIANRAVTTRRIHQSKVHVHRNALGSDADIFDEETVVFGNLTATEIMRSMAVLRICSIPGFSDNAARVRLETLIS